ncbi:MAG: DUF2807 domain-containing protein [Flavobacteriaceae bacterium]|nr:DUF2807 domain-containing protein [Flavobacteriaceae bacterium]
MKNYIKYFTIIILFFGCDSEDAGNCFQTAGNSIQQEFTVDSFDKILINERIELIIKEGTTQKVIVETGKNLMNDIDIQVVNNEVIATNNNTCNFVRDYSLTKVIITSPNITRIRNSSELAVRSDGVLTFPSLNLVADDFQSDFLNVGDFYISVNNTGLSVVSNGISNFYIDGQTTNLNIGFHAGDSRFEGRNLVATNVTIIHKSTNDMLVNPQTKIEGDIYSLGDVIAYNQPAIVDVTEHYQGKLIFN